MSDEHEPTTEQPADAEKRDAKGPETAHGERHDEAAGKDVETSPHAEKRSRKKGRKDDPLRQSMASRTWLALIGIAVLLVLLVIFVVQNTQTVKVTFLGWSGHVPLAVALLIAVAVAILVTAAAGTLRILQLRYRVRREQSRHSAEKKRAS